MHPAAFDHGQQQQIKLLGVITENGINRTLRAAILPRGNFRRILESDFSVDCGKIERSTKVFQKACSELLEALLGFISP